MQFQTEKRKKKNQNKKFSKKGLVIDMQTNKYSRKIYITFGSFESIR